jgi:pimeloyl-ACP methyl ester carboxylesterase
VKLEREVVPGRPDLPPLVFLHEGLGSLALWRDFPRRVSALCGDPTTVVYSRAGYGHSPPARLPRPVTYMHDEALVALPRVLADASLERPVLVGHSDGASIALLHASGGNPVTALVLLAPHVFVEDRTIAGIEAATRAYDEGPLRTRLARHHADVDATFRGWSDIWLSPEFRTWNITSALPAITSPILLIQESDDPYGTLAQLDAIESGVPASTPVTRLVLPGTGHSPHESAPGKVATAIATFLQAPGVNP